MCNVSQPSLVYVVYNGTTSRVTWVRLSLWYTSPQRQICKYAPQLTIRVGSSLLIQTCSSFAFDADRTYELEDVNNVNVKRF